MGKRLIIDAIVILYAILFLYSGFSKLTEYRVFKEEIEMTPLLAPLSKLIAATLPWLEFLITLILVIPKWRLKGFLASAGLMTSFTIYLFIKNTTNEQIPCSCGGILSSLPLGPHIVLNCTFIFLSLLGFFLERSLQRARHKEIEAKIAS